MAFLPASADKSSEGGNGLAFGTRFHQETDRLAKWLTSSAQLASAAAIDSPDDLLQFLWQASLQDFTDKLLSKGKDRQPSHSQNEKADRSQEAHREL